MKQIFIALIAVLLTATSAQAQITYSKAIENTVSENGTISNNADQDTLALSGTEDTLSYTFQIKGSKPVFTMAVDVTKVSGTVGGEITLYGRLYTTHDWDSITTVTITDASKTYYFKTLPDDYKEYKADIAGDAATFTAYFDTWVLWRP